MADGVEIHWEEQGEGPLVVIAHHSLWSYPEIYADLIADLARDHRVVIYDPRGCGRSSRRGPYEPELDARDLLAVAEAAGGGAVAIAVGDGFNRAARVAAARPDLIAQVIAIGPAAAAFLPRAELRDTGVLAASESVVAMLLQMLTTDPRSALRTILDAINPELSDKELRERLDRVLEYLEPEAAHARARAWLEDDVGDETGLLGERLWILHGGADPMYEGALGARVAELFPNAHREKVADGPITRPELTAARVRRLSGVAAA